MTQQIILIGNERPYTSPYNSVGVEICHNLYTEISPTSTTKQPYYFIKIPGLRLLSPETSATSIGGCRGLFTASNNSTYICNSNKVMRLLENGSRELIGTIGTYTGNISFADNGTQMMIVDGMNGWIYDFTTATFTKITDQYFPGNNDQSAPNTVVCIDTYFIVNIPSTNSYYWSNSYYQYLDDATQIYENFNPAVVNGYWTPLQSGQKIARAGNILKVLDTNNMLWLFGNNSIEVHYNTGNPPQIWARYQSAILEVGLAAKDSPARYANNIFWLGSDKNGAIGVFVNDQYSPKRISTRGIEQIINLMPKYTDAVGYVYSQSGHTFYILQFLSAKKTLVFDIITGAWHERTYLDKDTGDLSCWKGMFSAFNFSENIVGDLDTDAYYWLDQQYYQNDDPDGVGVNYIKCQKTTSILWSNGNRIKIHSIQPMLQQGTGTNINTVAGVGQDPTMQIAISRDSGNSYSTERMVSIGRMGQYGYRSRSLTWGIGRNIVFKLTVTDPVQVIIVGLLADVTPLAN
jgi:hypothetical protein